jgi:hypothetical protein
MLQPKFTVNKWVSEASWKVQDFFMVLLLMEEPVSFFNLRLAWMIVQRQMVHFFIAHVSQVLNPPASFLGLPFIPAGILAGGCSGKSLLIKSKKSWKRVFDHQQTAYDTLHRHHQLGKVDKVDKVVTSKFFYAKVDGGFIRRAKYPLPRLLRWRNKRLQVTCAAWHHNVIFSLSIYKAASFKQHAKRMPFSIVPKDAQLS